MRIICTSCVVNRQLAHQPLVTNRQQESRRYSKSTLALCKLPKSDNKKFCIILFSATNKTGVKYPINDNVGQILIRFINEGKATIQFKQPPHDIYIQADVTQLKQFLTLLKKILQNKLTPQDMKPSCISSIDVTALDHNAVAPTKLSIKSRSDYPVKGFPKTLEVLQINDVARLSFDMGILKLMHLRSLDLSNNLIEFIPEELNSLRCLIEINISSNQMGKSAPRKWDWMGGHLSTTLKALNLSSNNLRYLPDQLMQLYALVTLNLDHNELQVLPSGIGNLRNLRIFTASNNHLVSFPGSIKKLKLDELDVCNNHMVIAEQVFRVNFAPKPLPVQTLREYAGRKVLLERMPFNKATLPLTLIRYLATARYCICGKACFDKYIAHKDILWLENITKQLRMSHQAGGFVPIELYFCSMQCFTSSHRRRPLVR